MKKSNFSLKSLAAVALVGLMASSAFAQSSAPASAGFAPPCEVALKSDAQKKRFFQVQTEEGQRCSAGAPMTFGWYRANSFLIEQVCDVAKPFHRSKRGSDEATEEVVCSYLGGIRSPGKSVYGMALIEVN